MTELTRTTTAPDLLRDRVAVDALRAEFTDAVMIHDFDRLASLFTDDGAVRMPDAHAEAVGRAAIRAAVERMQGRWEFFVQVATPGAVVPDPRDPDAASGRTFLEELGRLRDGTSHRNHGIYHDRYRRTADGWRFAERVYELRYVDETPLPGTPGLSPAAQPVMPAG
jgi:ketosteroid isomerase-like protein